MDYSLFELDKKLYGVPMPFVREVLIGPSLTPVPLSSSYLVGITNFRGEVLPVFEISPLIQDNSPSPNSPLSQPQQRSRVLVLTHEQSNLGLSVDYVDRTKALQKSNEEESQVEQKELTAPVEMGEQSFTSIHLKLLTQALENTFLSPQLINN